MKWRPSLRLILLLINLLVMLLPLGGIAWLRLYESALVRQTESELLAQGAVVAAAYKAAWLRMPGEPALADLPAVFGPIGEWQPRQPRLDLAVDPIQPRPDDAQPTPWRAEPRAAAVGAEFSPVLQDVRRTTLAGIRVLDHQGIVVASTAGDFGGQLTQPEVLRALRGETVSLLRERHSQSPPPVSGSLSRATGIRVFVALPVIHQNHVLGAVLLARTPASIWDTIQGKRWPLVYASLALLALVLTLSWLTTRTIARPIAELGAQAQRAARGESGAVQALRHAGTREVAELSTALAAMAQTLEARADYIRRFAAHVSHEFKTPLTSIRGAVELLRDHADALAPDERARFQDMIAADTARLDRLVRRLLELARADVTRPGHQRSDALAVLRDSAARAESLGSVIQTQFPDAVAWVPMPAEELETVFANLLDNARLHAPGYVLRLAASIEGSALLLSFEDTGPGISAANAARIFEPFFTTARGSGSTGLGLAIIRALLTAHGGDISLRASDAGAVFLVRLPLKL
ncbi:MAG: sensor histidine kinase [Hydrocarboniphaga sp.]|uniref:sensor histidine kinase n=1 Tax=Hydrocarboniphaga sp. TaxID=2033016 RepID=UPI002632574C|nr:HAMP domain-containing sensor histidine kinase [Hydrocarboniphaga sp.]MDB5968273.1 sensor histidine kinase [Hydrocarboniphaga sp.]